MDEVRRMHLLTHAIPRFRDFSGATIYTSYKVISFAMVSIGASGELIELSCSPGREAWFFIKWLVTGAEPDDEIIILGTPKRPKPNNMAFAMVTDGEIWCEAVEVGTGKWFCALDEDTIQPPNQAIVKKFIKQTLPLYIDSPAT